MITCICPNPSIDTFVWIDHWTPGEVHRIQREERFPGGKGVHVAMAVAELAEPCQLLGIWGGPTGAWIRDACSDKGIVCAGIETAGWNRTCLTFKSDSEVDESELLGCGPDITEAECEEFLARISELCEPGGQAALSGSWPQGAPSNAYARLITTLQAKGAQTFLDCAGRQLPEALRANPFCVHLNQEEAKAVFGTDTALLSLNTLSEQCALAVVSDGARGAWFKSEQGTVHAHVHVDVAASSVGSGDCMMAGIAVACARHNSLDKIATLATACGAANCLRPELGMINRDDVNRLITACKLEDVS